MLRRVPLLTTISALVAGVLGPAACGGAVGDDARSTSATDAGSDGANGDAGVLPDGGGVDAAPLVPPGFTPFTCATSDDGAPTFPLASLGFTPPFDYAERRVQDGYRRNEPDTVIETVGTKCAKATDAAACAKAVAAIDDPVQLTCSVPYPCSVEYLVTTTGDKVETFAHGRDDIGARAAPIDTAAEAGFVAAWSTRLACANGSYRATADGFDVAFTYFTDRCTEGTSARHDAVVHVARSGAVTPVSDQVTPVVDDPNVGCAAARRAHGVAYARAAASDAASWLAHAAHLEAASVGSFARLARELAAHGAPRELVARAAVAAKDERRHARTMRALARSLGARVAPAPRVPRVVRDLEAIALENAVEGETRETWGAIVAAYQARAAESTTLRAAFACIAEDEAAHAELARDVAAWLEARLAPEARARVALARRACLETLAPAPDAAPAAGAAALGLPSGPDAVRLWSAARATILAA